jgi:hypothetical protein
VAGVNAANLHSTHPCICDKPHENKEPLFGLLTTKSPLEYASLLRMVVSERIDMFDPMQFVSNFTKEYQKSHFIIRNSHFGHL